MKLTLTQAERAALEIIMEKPKEDELVTREISGVTFKAKRGQLWIRNCYFGSGDLAAIAEMLKIAQGE